MLRADSPRLELGHLFVGTFRGGPDEHLKRLQAPGSETFVEPEPVVSGGDRVRIDRHTRSAPARTSQVTRPVRSNTPRCFDTEANDKQKGLER